MSTILELNFKTDMRIKVVVLWRQAKLDYVIGALTGGDQPILKYVIISVG